MFNCITNIIISQNPTKDFPNRKADMNFNFVNSFECEDCWEELTDTAKITLPSNIYYRDKHNNLVRLDNNIGGFSDGSPYFLKGDSIAINFGYKYFDITGKEIENVSDVYQGYITKVSSKMPFTLECEDNMWKLKQIAAPTKLFKASEYTLESMLKELLKDTYFTVSALTSTIIGDFNTTNTETVCQVLQRLQKDYHLESYFNGTELRCGVLVYVEQDAIDDEKKSQKIFEFQKNIIEDDLDYVRKDDVLLSAKCYSINSEELETLTKDGNKKTKKVRLEAKVGNEGGETRTLYFWNVTDVKELENLGNAELSKYYYTGFRGTFTTFGIPFVRQGDNVTIKDNLLPERNGYYKVRKVEYSGGVNGHRQVIHLDYKIR